MAATHAEHQRNMRKDALREMLSKQKHVEQASDIATEFKKPIDRETQDRLKTKFDMHMKLVNKYLPDLKQSEVSLSGDGENPLALLIKELSGGTAGLPVPSGE